MKVLHLCESITGGISTYVNELLPYQIDLYGIDNVSIVIPASQEDQIDNTTINIHSFKRLNRKNLWDQLVMVKTYYKILKSFRPTVVHIHSTFAGFWFRLFLLFYPNRKFKVFYCSHGWAFDRETSKFSKSVLKLVERVLSNVTDKILCISEYDLHSALQAKISKSKLILLKNTINKPKNVKKQDVFEPDICNYLFVGRLDTQKGYDILFKAFESVKRKDIALWCIGNSVVSLPESNRSTDKRIKFLGWQPKSTVLNCMHEADALIVPSRWEGFGLVALEALSVGCPVFHSGAGGLPDIHTESKYYQKLDLPTRKSLERIFSATSKNQLLEYKAQLKKEFKLDYDMNALCLALNQIYLEV